MAGTLTIVGLGPGDPALRSLAVSDALRSGERLILRTWIHPGLCDLEGDPRVTSCDDLYERSCDFDALYDAIADRVIAEADGMDIVYAVPGSPMQGEQSVQALLARAASAGIGVTLIPSVGAVDLLASSLGIDLMREQVQIVDAVALAAFMERQPFAGGTPDVSPLRPALVVQVYSRAIASAAKLALSRTHGDEAAVMMLRASADGTSIDATEATLFQIDRLDVDHLTSIYVPAVPALAAPRSPMALLRIVAQLRAPAGCAWDRAQTISSLRDGVIEEAYEVADAIDDADPEHLAEELGDLLLQVAMLSQIADESGQFDMSDVVQQITSKLLRRHPHVFGDAVAETPSQVVTTWDEVKRQERSRAGPSTELADDPFDRLPRSMPVVDRIADILGSCPIRGDRVDALADAAYRALVELIQSGGRPSADIERAYRRDRNGRSTPPSDIAYEMRG